MKLRICTAYIFISIIIVMAGCSSSKAPKDALLDAMTKTMEADSYSLSMSIEIDELATSHNNPQENKELFTIIELMKDASIHVNAIYAKEPMRTDMNVEFTLPSLLNMKLNLPMIVTKEMLYIEIPAIPLLPLPDSVKDKYVMIDLNELAEQQESSSSLDFATRQSFTQEASLEILKQFDENNFNVMKATEAGLPEGLKADQLIEFAINEENFAESMDTVVNKVVPGLLDLLLENDAYLPMLQLDKAVIEEQAAEWETRKPDVLNKLKNEVRINKLQLTNAIKDDHLVYQAGQFNIVGADAAAVETAKLGMSFNVQYFELNKSPAFEAEIPTETVTLEQLMHIFQSPSSS